MTEFGIWSDAAGGFIERGFWGDEAATQAAGSIAAFIEDGEAAEDLTLVEMCGEHDEQRADACEECNAEDDEDEEG